MWPVSAAGPASLHCCRPSRRQLRQVCAYTLAFLVLALQRLAIPVTVLSDSYTCLQSTLQAKRDPDSDDSMDTGGRDPPNIFWRDAALMYIIPWIDVIALGREVYHHFPFSIVLFLIPGMHRALLRAVDAIALAAATAW